MIGLTELTEAKMKNAVREIERHLDSERSRIMITIRAFNSKCRKYDLDEYGISINYAEENARKDDEVTVTVLNRIYHKRRFHDAPSAAMFLYNLSLGCEFRNRDIDNVSVDEIIKLNSLPGVVCGVFYDRREKNYGIKFYTI
jgi:hypothetical protein